MRIINGVYRIDNGIQLLEKFLLVIVFSICVVAGSMQVVFRYIIQSSLSWSEELLRYMLVWLSFFAASLGMSRTNVHISVDLIITKLPERIHSAMEVLWRVICLFFAGRIFLLSLILYENGVTSRQVSAAMQLPMKYVYLGVSVALLFMTIHLLRASIEQIMKILTEGKPGRVGF